MCSYSSWHGVNGKTSGSSRDETKRVCFWLRLKGQILKFGLLAPISPSYSLFSSCPSVWREIKASMKRANRRRRGDVAVRSQSVCLGLLCACVCSNDWVCVCTLNWAWLLKPRSLSNTSLLLLTVQEGSPHRPWKVGLHLSKFTSNWPRRVISTLTGSNFPSVLHHQSFN